jgi:hypothetical protein
MWLLQLCWLRALQPGCWPTRFFSSCTANTLGTNPPFLRVTGVYGRWFPHNRNVSTATPLRADMAQEYENGAMRKVDRGVTFRAIADLIVGPAENC